MPLLKFCVGLNTDYTRPGSTSWRTLNTDYRRPGRTIWKSSDTIVKVLCWFESKLYTSRTYNLVDLQCNCEGFVFV